MKIGNIIKCGIYHSKNHHPTALYTQKRSVDHFEFEFIASCSNHAQSFIGDEHYPLSPRNIIMRKPGQTTNSRLHFVSYYIHIDIPKTSEIYQDLISLPDFYHFINAERYQSIFENLIKHNLKSSNSFDDYYTSSKLLELFYYLKKDALKNERSHLNETKKTLAIQKAVSFMKKNFDKKISLQDLAELTKLSPSHFHKIFSESMDLSPLKYLENIRLTQAKFLLMENKTSLADIAYSCGFSSQAYFSLQFKRLTGLSPKEFQANVNSKYID